MEKVDPEPELGPKINNFGSATLLKVMQSSVYNNILYALSRILFTSLLMVGFENLNLYAYGTVRYGMRHASG